MQAQKEAPPDMQCKDKFLLQSVVASPGATAKDISPEIVMSQILLMEFLVFYLVSVFPPILSKFPTWFFFFCSCLV